MPTKGKKATKGKGKKTVHSSEQEPHRQLGEKVAPVGQPPTEARPARAEQAKGGETTIAGEKTGTAAQSKIQQANCLPFFQSFSTLNIDWWKGTKQMAAWYIDTAEKLAREMLDSQEKALNWAQDTLWAPLFQSQTTLAHRWVEGSANLVRRFWQIEQGGAPRRKAEKELG